MAKSSEKKAEEQELSIEEGFEKLEELIEQLEDPDVELEPGFKLYEEGVRLLKGLNSRIDAVEKKVRMLQEDGELADFNGEEE